MDWNKAYGNAHDMWPVEVGQLWKVGPHQLLCEDFHQGDPKSYNRIIKIHPDMVYCDPPWDPGNAKSFRTKAGVPDPSLDFREFMKLLIGYWKNCKGYVVYEMGAKWNKEVQDMIGEAGGTVLNEWPIYYFRRGNNPGRPCILVRCTWNEDLANKGPEYPKHEPPVDEEGEGLNDDKTPLWAIENFSQKGDVVADYCTGKGCTAWSADQLDRVFVGTELHPRRMANAIAKLVYSGKGHVAECPESVTVRG